VNFGFLSNPYLMCAGVHAPKSGSVNGLLVPMRDGITLNSLSCGLRIGLTGNIGIGPQIALNSLAMQRMKMVQTPINSRLERPKMNPNLWGVTHFLGSLNSEKFFKVPWKAVVFKPSLADFSARSGGESAS